MENCRWMQELQSYSQYEEERIFNLDNLLMEFKETYESTQHTIKNLEIEFGKLAKEVAKFVVTREENFVEVEAHEESIVEEHPKFIFFYHHLYLLFFLSFTLKFLDLFYL